VCVACSVVCRRAAHGVRLCVLPALGMPMAHPLFLLSALHVGALQGNKEPAKIISDRLDFCLSSNSCHNRRTVQLSEELNK
jgi:hypothetical protein